MKTNNKDCHTYIDPVTDTTTASNICKTYDFTNLMDLKLFVNATWYSADPTYMQNLQDTTGLNSTATTKLFDTTDADSFGSALLIQTKALSTQYDCSNANNCTAGEIAGLQWGSAGVTLNPVYSNSDYLIPSSSVKAWWDIEWPAIEKEPEYYSYVSSVTSSSSNASPAALPAASVAVVVTNATENFGLNNYYNTGRLVNAYAANDQTALDAVTTAISYPSEDFMKVMRYHIQDYTLGGALKTYTAMDLINGYENDIAAKVNGG